MLRGMVLRYGALALSGGDHRGVQRLGESQQLARRLRLSHAAAGPDEGTAGVGQQFRGLSYRFRAWADFGEHLGLGQLHVDGRGQNVPRDFDLHRPGPPGSQLFHRVVDHTRNFSAVGGPLTPFGQVFENVQLLSHFMERAPIPPQVVAFDLPRDQQHR